MGWPRIDQDGSHRARPGAPRDDETWLRTGLFWVQYPRLITLQIHDRPTLRTVVPTPIVNKARADSLDEINLELAVRHALFPLCAWTAHLAAAEGTIWTCQWVPAGDTRGKPKTHRYPAGCPPATEKR
jgi:hypothetical protein